MQEKPYYKYFQEEKDDKISQKIFIKFIVMFFVFYLVVIGLSYAFYQNFTYITISGKSMMSTLNPEPVPVKTERGIEYLQDGVYIKRTHDVEYEDIVVLDTSSQNSKNKSTIIKRVIALEGDYVSIVKLEREKGDYAYHVLRVKANTNKVEVLNEEYIYSYENWTDDGSEWDVTISGVTYEHDFYTNFIDFNYISKTFNVKDLDEAEVTFFQVPEDNFFFLGDNRANSNDSRSLGFLNLSKIDGRVVDIVRDGSEYKGNNLWWFNRAKGFFRVIWKEILVFFGGNA